MRRIFVLDIVDLALAGGVADVVSSLTAAPAIAGCGSPNC
jgi:hypothetical protein